MITDGEFSALITEAAETIPEPTAPMPSWRRPASRSTPIGRFTIAKVRSTHAASRSRRSAPRQCPIVIAVAASSSSSPSRITHRAPDAAPLTARHYRRRRVSGGCHKERHVFASTERQARKHHHTARSRSSSKSALVSRRRAAAIATSLAGTSHLQCGLAGSSRVDRGARCSRWRIRKSGERGRVTRHLKHLSTTATDVTGQVATRAQVSALEALDTARSAVRQAGTIQALSRPKRDTSVQSQINTPGTTTRSRERDQLLEPDRCTRYAERDARLAPSRFSKACTRRLARRRRPATLLADSGHLLFCRCSSCSG